MKILTMLVAAGVNDPYVDYYKITTMNQNENIIISQQDVGLAVRRLLDCKYEGILSNKRLWKNVIDSGVSVEKLIEETDFDNWMCLVDEVCEKRQN